MELLQRELGAAGEGWRAGEAEERMDAAELLRLKNQMKQQLTDYGTATHTSQESVPDHVIEEKLVTKTTEDLERDIEELKVSFQNKTLALQRMQLMAALKNKVKQNDNDSGLIMEVMKQIVKISRAVIEYQKQAREKERKLMDLKRKRLSLKKAGGQKLLQIRTMMKKRKDERTRTNGSKVLETIYHNLQKEREMTTVIQNIFQTIIIGSRINWAENPSLKSIVLKLEKNVYFM